MGMLLLHEKRFMQVILLVLKNTEFQTRKTQREISDIQVNFENKCIKRVYKVF